jgi:hypothetical protein
MDLYARLFPLGEASQAVLERLLPSAELVFENGRCPVSVDNPLLPRVLAAAELTRGFWVSAECMFTRAELRTIAWFEPACRCVLPETEADFAANRTTVDAAPEIDAGAPERIRLPQGLVLSRVAMKPNVVGAIGDWLNEFAVGAAVADVLRHAGCSGLELLPMRHPDGRPHPGVFQMSCTAVLPPAALDAGVHRIQSRIPSEHGKLSLLGCLAYARPALEGRPDFNRTAEPWMGWFGQAGWVVSARVVALFAKWKLRGWHFRPVLTVDTELYAQYRDLWRRLRGVMNGVVHSTFVAGQWGFLPAAKVS